MAATDRFFPKINGTNIKLEKGEDLGEDFKLIKNIEFTYRNYKFVIETGQQGTVTSETGKPTEISFDSTQTRVIGPNVPIRATAGAAAGVVAGKQTSLLLGAEPYPFHKNNSRPLNFSSSGVGGGGGSGGGGFSSGSSSSGGSSGFLKRVEAAAAAAAGSTSKAASSTKPSSLATTRSASTSSGGGSSSSGGRPVGGAASPVTIPRAGGAASSPRAVGGAASPAASPRASGGLQKGGIKEESFLAQAGSHSTLRKRKTRKNINRHI